MRFTDFFKRNSQASTPVPPPTSQEYTPSQAKANEASADFIEVESYAGGTFHALPNLDRNGARIGKATLCGYENWIPTPSSSPIDATKASQDTTGHNWNYCPKCRDALLAIEGGRAEASQFPNTTLLDLRKS